LNITLKGGGEMKVRFALQFGEELLGVGRLKNCEVVGTHRDPKIKGAGYDIIEAEVNGIWEIKVKDKGGVVWVAADTFPDKDEDGCYQITLWEEFEEAV
jgi:hypothetical protein